MASALDVARYLIHLAAEESEPDYLSHLRLQKLLYYVQGWSLAIRKKPMFSSRIEAWANGPVVKSLYPHFAGHGFSPIPPDDVEQPKALSDKEKVFVESVWEAYKGFSATSLRDMTHQEAPWCDARRGLEPAERSNREITRESVRAFFTKGEK